MRKMIIYMDGDICPEDALNAVKEVVLEEIDTQTALIPSMTLASDMEVEQYKTPVGTRVFEVSESV